ncbi:HepT-like ribonuclease domain-containing protein [uncultured Algoriphagus sp.]|uniref:HepT-like ribonuclease domain-containing protein n=1 Tax=uncultured Algoriphagus sp. TaxID=417365 RepID=UPI0030EE85F2|tara:strand:- start:2739 stop:3056 length:318 start_codon:yes stop_codon:yes gene_type:complete
MNAKHLKYTLDIQSIIEELEIIKIRVGNDFIVKRAVERDLEIIGEAVKKLTELDSTIKLSSIKKIIGLRNMISHAYDSIEDELIWAIIQKDIPILEKEIKSLRDL